MVINITVNNTPLELLIDDGEFLSKTLRKAGFLSVREGCDTGSCGSCTVVLGEKAVLSCSYLSARADGKSITTLEGVQGEAQKLAAFIADEGAEQCGFCLSGLVMTVMAMRKELNDPTEEGVKHYLSGCLCRCTGYVGQTRAVMRYLEASR